VSDTTIQKHTTAGGAGSVASKRAPVTRSTTPWVRRSASPKRCSRTATANQDGEPAYVRVGTGLFGMRAVLIPVQFVETDETRKTIVLK
jgi:hypothetical protein